MAGRETLSLSSAYPDSLFGDDPSIRTAHHQRRSCSVNLAPLKQSSSPTDSAGGKCSLGFVLSYNSQTSFLSVMGNRSDGIRQLPGKQL